MAIEIVGFPIKNGDFPVRYVKLPEGISSLFFFRPHSIVVGKKKNSPSQYPQYPILESRV